MSHAPRHPFAFALLVSGTVLGIAGTDLVLPAVPGLPRLLGGTPEAAQLVLAAFTGGAAVGLVLFGELGARFDQRRLLVGSLLAYAGISALCIFSPSLDVLIGARFLQGAAGSAAAVFAPGMLRALYGDAGAVRALGLLGSIEALTPALAPVAGVWLFEHFGWRAAFDTIAVLALVCAVLLQAGRASLPAPRAQRGRGGYGRLLASPPFLCLALSQAFTLGALLVFVFGAPAVITTSLGGSLGDFIVMQMSGIALFVLAANLTGRIVPRVGAGRVILAGTLVSALGGTAMLAYALAGGGDIAVVIAIFLLLNLGLGLRGPPGFHAAIVAAEGDDARGAALVVVAILLATALGTAAVAPFIAGGLVSIAAGAAVLSVSAVLLLARPRARRLPQSTP
ncbi:MFS transporter [Labrys wisconsinensis]|uniref:MFS family arabinose efflux permease n=1 Tax=Labrys wisconsinensis TaxID=425677 RepID=A0ABU0JIZ0_9HYPH|nr:MFS transporter [Labrys wisconsinensis]MDQ0474250.1 putative MFS family arabinose efflux permease [Labrys wisconsinensis]